MVHSDAVPKLSVTIITRNEAANIRGALDAVSWADERIVIDAESTDGTARIAETMGARVIVRPWPGYGAQKNHAAALASHDWILSIDADERPSPELATEIRALLSHEPQARGYRVKRVTHYLGRWIRTTDWYPDYQLRLYDRRAGTWSDRAVHESVQVQGPVLALEHELQHFAYRSVAHHIGTINRYTTLAAEEMLRQGRRTTLAQVMVHPALAFLRNYVLRGGVRDGAVGLIVSTMNAFYVFAKFLKLRELQRRAPTTGAAGPPPS